MDVALVEAGIAVIGALGSVASGYVALTLKAQVADLRREAAEARLRDAEARLKDREETRAWINGSFMRSAVVEARWMEMQHRLRELERHAEG